MPQNPQRFWIAAFIVAWSVDFLFWEKPAGVSFVIFVFFALAAGFVLARMEAIQPARLSYLLGGLVFLLATVTIWRSEGFTRVFNGMLAMFALALLVLTFRSGAWARYRMMDYVMGSFELMIAGLSRAIGTPIFPKSAQGSPSQAFWKQAAPVLRGVILAVPIVLVLGSLLVSADLIFANQIEQIFKAFDLDHLPEYFFRLFYIVVFAYAFAGLYLYALLPRPVLMVGISASAKAAVAGEEGAAAAAMTATAASASDVQAAPETPEAEAVVQPAGAQARNPWQFLGAIETFIVLGSVNLLFAFFVGVQFRYFFGGQANIREMGYTYSEYARRGFFELVVVAVLSLLLYLTLNAITQRKTAGQERTFTVLSVLLVGLVWVILVSAFQRLLLYEDVYGFTSLRTYTHIFIPWLGFLLLATIVLQIVRRDAYFGALLLLTTFGFSLTLGLINMDGFIADQNIQRARRGMELDGPYLNSLSDDALPVLVREYRRSDHAKTTHDTLGFVLACRVYQISQEARPAWQSYHPGQALARQTLVGVDLKGYLIQVGARGPALVTPTPLNCETNRSWD